MSELARVMSAVNNSAPVTTWKKGVDIAGAIPNGWAVLASVPTAIGVATGAKPALQQGRSISGLLSVWDGMVKMRWLRGCILRLGFRNQRKISFRS